MVYRYMHFICNLFHLTDISFEACVLVSLEASPHLAPACNRYASSITNANFHAVSWRKSCPTTTTTTSTTTTTTTTTTATTTTTTTTTMSSSPVLDSFAECQAAGGQIYNADCFIER